MLLAFMKMNSAPVVFISILEQLIISLYSSLNAVRQLQYSSTLHYTDGNILKYKNNIKGLDFSSLLTCRDLHSAFTNFCATFSQRHISSLPLTYRDLEKTNMFAV